MRGLHAVCRFRSLTVHGVHLHEAHMKTKTCPDCNGDGVVDKGMDDEHQCPTCGGCGFVPDDDDDEDVINTSPINHP
jgi:DnaJ-class molecular chaperone